MKKYPQKQKSSKRSTQEKVSKSKTVQVKKLKKDKKHTIHTAADAKTKALKKTQPSRSKTILAKKSPRKKQAVKKQKEVSVFWQHRAPFAIVFGGLLFLFAMSAYFVHTNGALLQGIFPQPSGEENEGGPREDLHPLTIERMRLQEYSGSDITIEQVLPPGSNYDRYITSYRSDGLKIYALLTVPQGDRPDNGWPAIIFNHGYIPPEDYRTTERYIEYTDAFSRNGYVVFRSDYRGHGNSEGNPEGGYYSPAYTIDVLNAVSSIKKLKDPLSQDDGELIVNSGKIGMWGHSMGGHLTLRTMVTTKDIKAGVIWAGVVASYKDLDKNWIRSYPFIPSPKELAARRITKERLIEKYGTVDENPAFWKSIAPISYVKDISGPIQIHHGTNDGDVPVLFSERLDEALKKANKDTELIIYKDDDHNMAYNLYTALDSSVQFFDKYLK